MDHSVVNLSSNENQLTSFCLEYLVPSDLLSILETPWNLFTVKVILRQSGNRFVFQSKRQNPSKVLSLTSSKSHTPFEFNIHYDPYSHMIHLYDNSEENPHEICYSPCENQFRVHSCDDSCCLETLDGNDRKKCMILRWMISPVERIDGGNALEVNVKCRLGHLCSDWKSERLLIREFGSKVKNRNEDRFQLCVAPSVVIGAGTNETQVTQMRREIEAQEPHVTVEVEAESGHRFVTAALTVNVPLETAFEIVSDTASLSRYVKDIESSTVIDIGKEFENETHVHQVHRFMMFALDIRMRLSVQMDCKQRWVQCTMIEGDMSHYEAQWNLERVERMESSATHLVFKLRAAPRIPMPSFVLEGLAKHSCFAMMKEIRTACLEKIAAE
eukprot:CAMPEP_0182445534 /NCGR_PEP_ID=MMETSP1172-20130603/3630_1 /TAXON_ID=708627 /ORGANISM="Timspurckia oligopyrenoides, Strain CCMP3278" /LENGTH=385 /DNA_ID=CAMNT_0024641329 /DNA_START=436 /DNA_END=1593 /DNA_ORIENTATION=+